MPYQLRTFGRLDLRDAEGDRIEALLGHSKGMALLVYLAVEAPEQGVNRSRVAALLWPDRTEERARGALRAALSRLRRAADPPPIEGKGEPVLRPARDLLEADVWAFREAIDRGDADRALAFYRGDFLAGFRVKGAPNFERWAEERRERFRDEAHEAALSAGRVARQRGDLDAAAHAFERALQLRPLREEGIEGLLHALAEGGRMAEALQRWEAFRQRRERELELAPSQGLQDLVDDIRDGEVASSPPHRRERIERSRGSSDDEGNGARSEGGEGGAASAEGSRTGLRRRAGLIVAIIMTLAVGALVLSRAPGGDGDTTTVDSGHPSIAVLPFSAIGEEDPSAVAEGLHTDLLTRLSHVSGLKVVSGTSTQRFRGTDLPLPAVADSLNAEWVLEGSVQHIGDEIAVNVQLIDPRNDSHAWAESYRRSLTASEVIDLQGDIATEVANILETRLSSAVEERLYRQNTHSLEAYRFYIRGRSLVEQRTVVAVGRGLDHFERAIAVDSGYALAWAGVADAVSLLAHLGGTASDSALRVAERAAQRALDLDADLAEARVAMGRIHLFRHEGPRALSELERAVELRTGYGAAHAWLGKLLLSLGRPADALEHAELAATLNPLSWENQATLVWACLANQKYKCALRAGRRATDIKAEAELEFTGRSHYEVVALSHLGRAEELRVIARETDRPFLHHPFIAFTLVHAGDTAMARELLRGAENELFPLATVLLNTAVGNIDGALAAMRQGFPREEGLFEVGGPIYLRYFWPERLALLRADPRYEAIMADVNRFWGLNPDGSLPGRLDASFGSVSDPPHSPPARRFVGLRGEV